MLLPRILSPVRACIRHSPSPLITASRILDAVRPTNAISPPVLSLLRHATHQSQGRANGAKDGPGKRLGAKKSGGEYVIPGNIIFRQRGTAWFPGENCKMGRDHCIFATQAGFVRYYRDPMKHPKRQYIGVVFDKNDKLPYPQNAARKRRLNMVPIQQDTPNSTVDGETVVNDLQALKEPGGMVKVKATPRNKASRNLVMGRGYAYREANWEIGRVAEKADVKVQKFVPGDRFTAWRRSAARIAAGLEQKRLRNAGKKVSKPKKKR